MEPHAEFVHWLFAHRASSLLGLIMVAEAIVGREVWRDAARGASTCGRGSPSASGS